MPLERGAKQYIAVLIETYADVHLDDLRLTMDQAVRSSILRARTPDEISRLSGMLDTSSVTATAPARPKQIAAAKTKRIAHVDPPRGKKEAKLRRGIPRPPQAGEFDGLIYEMVPGQRKTRINIPESCRLLGIKQSELASIEAKQGTPLLQLKYAYTAQIRNLNRAKPDNAKPSRGGPESMKAAG